MLRERIVWVVALLLVGGAAFYSGQVIGVRDGQQNRTTAMQQFFGQRGGQAGQAGQASGQGGFGRGSQGGGGVNGTVSNVSGNTITITTRNGQTTQVQLASGGAVRKQVDGQLSDLKTGDQVVAIGTQNGDTFQATSIQIGGFGGRGGQGGTQGGNQGGSQSGSGSGAGTGGTTSSTGTSTTSGTDTGTTPTATRTP